MNAVSEAVSTEREALLGLFTSLLRPLMPTAQERGISANEVSDAIRRAYVQVLEARMSEQNRELSDSRLAIVAGLTRSEVRRFRSSGGNSKKDDGGKDGERLYEVAKLLSVWHTHPKFSGAYGLALDLDLVAEPGAATRRFSDLVETVYPGADPEAILDQLIAIDSVELVDQTTVRCRRRVAIFGKSDNVTSDRIGRAAKCLEAAASSFAHNLQQDSSGSLYFERMVVSNHPLSPGSRDAFALVAQDRGDEYVAGLDTWLSNYTKPDHSPGAKRYGVGVYFFEEVQDERLTGADGGAELGSSELAEKQGSSIEIDVLAPPDSIRSLSKNPGNKDEGN